MDINDFSRIANLIEKRNKINSSISDLSIIVNQIKENPDFLGFPLVSIKISGLDIPFSDSSFNSIVNYSYQLLRLDLENIEKELTELGVKLESKLDEQAT